MSAEDRGAYVTVHVPAPTVEGRTRVTAERLRALRERSSATPMDWAALERAAELLDRIADAEERR